MIECGCHEWYDTSEVGDWPRYLPGAVPARSVREHAADPGLWDAADLTRETLSRLIAEAGGVRHDFPLLAQVVTGGPVMPTDGIHRWAVAAELGIPRLPFVVTRIPPESPMTEWG